MNRKKFISLLTLFLLPLLVLPQIAANAVVKLSGNFAKIYKDSSLKKKFYLFLKNIFNLIPEQEFHDLIAKVTNKKNSDKEIYLEVQKKLDNITPLLSTFTHQLPSLKKQKKEMAKQAVELLGKDTSYDGYLEIGSAGRYLDYLEEEVNINGERYYAADKKPGYSISEMIDRGQITVGANYIPLASYHTNYAELIPQGTLDLVTVYIGFHHCPLHLRVKFISSIATTIRKGGKLILRDHDCDNENQKTIVALAHDVFNLGTNQTWQYNQDEIRNFYTLDFIIEFVEKLGFKFEGKSIFQKGDPTKNALILFTKIN
jgi:SAM-dependent methyltransferase